MSRETEIEKKYKVLSLPNGLPDYPHKEIEQSYLNKGGEPIRLRRFEQNGEVTCLLSKKVRESDIRCTEHNIPLPREVYEALKEAKEGRTIRKTRYIIPLDGGLNAELDVFHDFFEGLRYAEIEFPSIEAAESYKVPDWLGEPQPSKGVLSNYYMAVMAEDIGEYREFMGQDNT